MEPIRRFETAAPVVALTFDDGPDDAVTPSVLDVLASYEVSAVFFCLGEAVARYPDVARRIVAEGHVLANHSWDHPHFAGLAADLVAHQLTATADAIRGAAGLVPRLVRPPYGEWTATVAEVVAARRETAVLWDVDSRDWEERAPAAIVDTVVTQARPGSIVLLHSASWQRRTLVALPALLEGLRARGLQPVRLDAAAGLPAYG
jgi:peptidoglycan/xylan/chitin deacetylase (PgdA/CDA1 family)